MSDLTRFREHCREMATAEHTAECVERLADWKHRALMRRYLDIPDPGPMPCCDGCVTDADRALFARLAAEVDDYLDPHPTLWGDA